jgi:hypothetical protein
MGGDEQNFMAQNRMARQLSVPRLLLTERADLKRSFFHSCQSAKHDRRSRILAIILKSEKCASGFQKKLKDASKLCMIAPDKFDFRQLYSIVLIRSVRIVEEIRLCKTQVACKKHEMQ